MTPQFTTPCYIKIDDAQQRKEVCEKLAQMEYNNIAIKDEEWILTQCESTNVNYLAEYMKKAIKCDSIPCFLDLAGMRSDTDKNQYFISKGWRDGFGNIEDKITKCLCDTLEQWGVVNNSPSSYNRENGNKFGWKRATAQEIINHHKQKGEKK